MYEIGSKMAGTMERNTNAIESVDLRKGSTIITELGDEARSRSTLVRATSERW
jgi:hypothetical protein